MDETIEEVRAQRDQMREALMEAWTDICQWQQLARYQREKMNNNLGWCPTQAGINTSESVKRMIGDAMSGKGKALTASAETIS